MQFSYKMEGFKEMEAALKALPDRMQKRVVRQGVRKGAVVIRKAVEQKAPVGEEPPNDKYGRLQDNIQVRQEFATKNAARFAVHRGGAFWADFFELGTVHQPARPFFRTAFDEAAEEAIGTIIKEWVKGLEREAKKLASDFKTASRAITGKRK